MRSLGSSTHQNGGSALHQSAPPPRSVIKIYHAVVRVSRDGVFHEDIGYGQHVDCVHLRIFYYQLRLK
jgi:hypothetical protein